uniref:Uncharacterized protein n=1 Tax=Klebsiella pneumoniae TaxID=573 RepID=A0A1J0QZM6_KLEPN|nr:hypothetical protein [Klebsiella pneumoniae]
MDASYSRYCLWMTSERLRENNFFSARKNRVVVSSGFVE